jgi:hypothetical protein
MRWTRQVSAQILCGRLILKRTAKSCGPGIPTLMLSWREMISLMTGARKPGPRGSAKDTVKTVAQGMPDDSADPVVTAASFSYCWRAMGEAFTPHSLRPLSTGGDMLHAHLGRETRCETATSCLPSDKLIRINAGGRQSGQMTTAPVAIE